MNVFVPMETCYALGIIGLCGLVMGATWGITVAIHKYNARKRNKEILDRLEKPLRWEMEGREKE